MGRQIGLNLKWLESTSENRRCLCDCDGTERRGSLAAPLKQQQESWDRFRALAATAPVCHSSGHGVLKASRGGSPQGLPPVQSQQWTFALPSHPPGKGYVRSKKGCGGQNALSSGRFDLHSSPQPAERDYINRSCGETD